MTKIKTTFAPAACYLIAIAALFFIASCNNAPGDSVVIPVPKDTSALAKIDHFIPEGEIREYRAAFAVEKDSLSRAYPSILIPDAEAFNKPALIAILKDPRSVGIRIYHGIKKGGKKNDVRLILVGVDSQGKDLLIQKGSALATQANNELGGEDHGQCPTCQTNE
ncbi:MAG: hypothetical protein QM726_26030 [Chitinophagaceae bacterium]